MATGAIIETESCFVLPLAVVEGRTLVFLLDNSDRLTGETRRPKQNRFLSKIELLNGSILSILVALTIITKLDLMMGNISAVSG
jgi:hypothetical protein